MTDQYQDGGFQARRQAGGVPPVNLGGLMQLISRYIAPQPPRQPDAPAYPDATPVPQSGEALPPTQTLLPDGPNQVAQPAPPPPERGASTRQPPEVEREPDAEQPDPTVQPIIDPDVSPPETMQPIIDPATGGPSTDPRIRTVVVPPDAIAAGGGGPGARAAKAENPAAVAAPAIPRSLIDPRTLQEQRGLPQRTDFQAFVPFSPKGYEHWGKPPWQERVVDTDPAITRTSLAPAPHEAYGGVQRAGLALGQWGTGPGAPFAMAAGAIAKMLGPFIDMLSGGGRTPFTSAFNAAETQSLAKQKFMWSQYKDFYEMERERMLDHGDEAVRREREDINRARDIIETAKNNGYSANAKENWDIAEQKLREWAVGRPKLLGVLDNGGIKALEAQLGWEDAQIDNLAINNRSLRASDRRRAEARGAKGGPTDLDKEWSSEDTPSGGDQRDAAGRLIPPGRGREEAPPEPKEDETESMSDVDREIARKPNRKLSRSAMNAAHQVLNKGVPEGMTRTSMKSGAPATFGRVLGAASDLENKIRDVARGDGTPEEKLAEINKIDPQMGETLEGLSSYALDPNKMRDNHDRNIALARQINKNYDPSFFPFAQKYRDPNTKTGQIMLRTATLPGSTLALLQSLKGIGEGDINFMRNLEALKARYYDGDPKYAAVHQAIRNYLTDVIAIQSGGVPRVTTIERAAQEMLATASPAAIRAQMMTDLHPAFGMINDVNKNWQRETKSNTNAPLYHQDNADMLDAIIRMNPYTGQVPEDAPDALKAVGKEPETGKGRPGWLKPPYDFKPLRRDDVNYWRDWLEKNPNHPDAQQVRELIGIVPDLRQRYGR